MRIWEAVVYALFGGAAELLPISFNGHAAILKSAFHMTGLAEGGGYYVRAAICLGVLLALRVGLRSEAAPFMRRTLPRGGRRRAGRYDPLERREKMLCACALVPMLISLIFTSRAERLGSARLIALLFAVNALLIAVCSARKQGEKTEKNALFFEVLLIGAVRGASVFPGLSSFGSSICLGRVCGFSEQYNLRFAYRVTFAYQITAFFYYLIRAFVFGSFSGMILLAMLLAALTASVTGYLAIQYFRYLSMRKKLSVFSFYCWGAAAIVLILALINA